MEHDARTCYLYDQIRLCILFNLDGAAITFCGMLVEYALKYATYRKENPAAASFDSSARDQFENIPLGPAITRARKAGLIDEVREKFLHSFREDLRNRYSHFNIQKITKDVSFPATEMVFLWLLRTFIFGNVACSSRSCATKNLALVSS